jgi:ethanolamine utilization protein EutJ
MLARVLNEMLIAPYGDPRRFLKAAAPRFRAPAINDIDSLYFGVDLGTATVVLTAVDDSGRPVYWDAIQCQAVHDGVVVNFAEAVATVRRLKAAAERALDCTIFAAATAHPPGVPQADCRACKYVLEQAEIECRILVDEISAAQALLRIEDGVIADVGGGSTGVGVFTGGRLVALSDRPGGGHYLDLILAGAQRIPVEEAERRKRMKPGDHAAVLRPGLERIATSIKQQIGKASVASVHLVGGAIRLPEASAIVARITGVPTQTYPYSDLITPFGIAVS